MRVIGLLAVVFSTFQTFQTPTFAYPFAPEAFQQADVNSDTSFTPAAEDNSGSSFPVLSTGEKRRLQASPVLQRATLRVNENLFSAQIAPVQASAAVNTFPAFQNLFTAPVAQVQAPAGDSTTNQFLGLHVVLPPAPPAPAPTVKKFHPIPINFPPAPTPARKRVIKVPVPTPEPAMIFRPIFIDLSPASPTPAPALFQKFPDFSVTPLAATPGGFVSYVPSLPIWFGPTDFSGLFPNMTFMRWGGGWGTSGGNGWPSGDNGWPNGNSNPNGGGWF